MWWYHVNQESVQDDDSPILNLTGWIWLSQSSLEVAHPSWESKSVPSLWPQSWTSFTGFGAITTGFTHGMGPFTDSMMSKSTNSLILDCTALLRWNRMHLNGWATGFTSGLMSVMLVNVGTYSQDSQSHCCLFSQQRHLPWLQWTQLVPSFFLWTPHMWMPPWGLLADQKNMGKVSSPS